jgi:ABC-type sugar transport system permease subunit
MKAGKDKIAHLLNRNKTAKASGISISHWHGFSIFMTLFVGSIEEFGFLLHFFQ